MVVPSLAGAQGGTSAVPPLWLESRDTSVRRRAGGKGQTGSCSCFDSQAPDMDM